jgi:hypothetical protein
MTPMPIRKFENSGEFVVTVTLSGAVENNAIAISP